VNVGGVYIGIDKIVHVFSQGRQYYQLYLRFLEKGIVEDEALERVLHWGLKQEKHILGGWTSGVVSFADLEANYQGFLLARDFCKGNDSYLVYTQDGWGLRRDINITNYVNPWMDESFNLSMYIGWGSKKALQVIREEYCPIYRLSYVQELLDDYEHRVTKSIFVEFARARFVTRRAGKPSRQVSLEEICSE
jgi:hypothetical protein